MVIIIVPPCIRLSFTHKKFQKYTHKLEQLEIIPVNQMEDNLRYIIIVQK